MILRMVHFFLILYFLFAFLYLLAFSPMIIISFITGYSVKLTNNVLLETDTSISSKKLVEYKSFIILFILNYLYLIN